MVGFSVSGWRGLGVSRAWKRTVEVSLQHIELFLMAENCLLREALVRVLRKKDDVLVVGAVAFSPSALEIVSAASPEIILFDSASIALAGPRLVSRMQRSGGSPRLS